MMPLLTTSGLPALLLSGAIALSSAGGAPPPAAPGPETFIGEVDWVHIAYVGEPTTLDFSATRGGTITGITPALPHTVDGAAITITPAAAAATATYTVTTSLNEAVGIEIVVREAPPPLELAGAPPTLIVEQGRSVPHHQLWTYHQNGTFPVTYEKVSGPDWMLCRSAYSYAAAAEETGSFTAVYRATDRRGDSVDIVVPIDVIPLRSRTPTYTLQAGDSDVSSAIVAQNLHQTGGVLYVPKALNSKNWGSTNISVSDAANPLIVRGDPRVAEDDETIIGINLKNVSGHVHFEDLTFRYLTDPPPSGADRFGVRFGSDVRLYRCRVEGLVKTIDPSQPDPIKGNPWETSDTFAYFGSGFRPDTSSVRTVLQECVADKIYEAVELRGLLVDFTVERYRDDGYVLQESDGAVIHGFDMRIITTGNRTTADHEDFGQSFTQNGAAPYLAVYRAFFSAEGWPMQGLFNQHQLFNSTSRTPEDMLHHWHFDEVAAFNGHVHSFYAERVFNGLLENSAILRHPDEASGDSIFNHAEGSSWTIRNSIIGKVGGDAQAALGHLIVLENSIEMDVATPLHSYADVFPNRLNGGLATEQRMQISTSWAAANPNIGPAILHQGTSPDTTAPVLQSTSPADNATSVGTNVSIVLTYDEPVKAGSGNLVVRNVTAGTDVEFIAAAAPAVSISGNTVTVDISDLVADSDWQITTPQGWLTDLAGNQAPAIGAGALTFTTGGAFSGTLNGPTSQISYRGVTWNFSSPVYWLASANGDPVVISDAAHLPSGTSITSTSPASASDRHGIMRDPADPDYTGQGFDTGLDDGTGGNAKNYTYTDLLNIDPGNTGSPISIGTGDAFSLVKAVSGSHNFYAMDEYVVLTVMNQLPPSEGTWFRPGPSAPVKAWKHRIEDMNFGVFPELAKISQIDWPESYYNTIIATKRQTVPTWIGSGEKARRSQCAGEPSTDGYSSVYAYDRAEAMLSLFLDPGGNATHIAGRQNLAILLGQWGIDYVESVAAGLTRSAGAGQWNGYRLFMKLAAFLFGSSEYLAWSRQVLTNSTDQPFWVTDTEVGFPVTYDTGNDAAGARLVGETFQAVELGTPNWLKEFAQIPTANAHIYKIYSETWLDVCAFELLAMGLLRNGPGGISGVEAVLDGPNDTSNSRAAAFAYLDRTATWRNETFSSNTFSHGSSTLAVYDAWRDELIYAGSPMPKWVGPADVRQSADDNEFSAGSSAGQINWNFSLTAHTTSPIVDREIEVSVDYAFDDDAGINVPYQYHKVATGAGVSGTISGLRHGTDHYCRSRQRNAVGWSRWSQNWPLRHHNASGKPANEMAPRRKATTPGTPSGTLQQVAAPVVLYKPYPAHEMGYFEPVSDATDVQHFYAGMGYWTGGTGGLSASYQWQRDTGGGFGDINGASSKKYSRTTADSGALLRCRVTVNGVVAFTNVVAVPAAETFPATTLISTDFQGRFPFNWPAAWSAMQAGLTNYEIIPFPNARMEPELTPGGLWLHKIADNPSMTADLTAAAPLNTSYTVELQVAGGYFPSDSADDEMFNDLIFEIRDGTGAIRGNCSWIIPRNTWTLEQGGKAHTFTGAFAIGSSGNRTVRLWVDGSPGAGSVLKGQFGGPVLTRLVIRAI